MNKSNQTMVALIHPAGEPQTSGSFVNQGSK